MFQKRHFISRFLAFFLTMVLVVPGVAPVDSRAYTLDDIVSVKTVDKDVILSVTPNSPWSMEELSDQLDLSSALSGQSVNMTTQNIDATDLSNWYVYDHYDTAAYADESAWQAATGYNRNLRPYYAYTELSSNLQGITQPLTISELAQNPSTYTWGDVFRLKEHIAASSQDGNAAMNFYGYGMNPYTDFLFYPADASGTKKVDYTISAQDVRTHSLSTAGFLFNCATANDKMTGYALLFKYGTSETGSSLTQQVVADKIESVTLYKLNDSDVDAFHNASDNSNPGHYGTAIATKNLSSLTFEGKFDVSDISLEITSNSLKAYMTAAGENAGATPDKETLFDIQSYDSTASNYNGEFSDTGYGGFGPIVGYMSHCCSYTSSYKYSNLRMSITSSFSVLDGVSNTDYTQKKDMGGNLVDSDKYFVLIGDNEEGEQGYKDYFKRQYDAVFLEKLKKEKVVLITNLNIENTQGINGTDYNLEDYLGVGNVIKLTSDNLSDMLQEITEVVKNNTYSESAAQAAQDAMEATASTEPAANCVVTYRGYQVETVNRSRIPEEGVELCIENPMAVNVTTPAYTLRKPDGTVVNLASGNFTVKNTAEWPSGIYTAVTAYPEGVRVSTTFVISPCHNCYFNGSLENSGIPEDGLYLTPGTVGVNKAAADTAYQTRLLPDEGYALPSSIIVQVDEDGDDILSGSETLNAGAAYSYNTNTGDIIINGEKVKGNIYITADTGKVEYDLLHVTTTAGSQCSYYETYTAQLEPESADYPMPETITLKLGGDTYTLTDSEEPLTVGEGTVEYTAGTLTISSGVLKGDLLVIARTGQFQVTNELTNVQTDNPATQAPYGQNYTAVFSPDPGYALPLSVAVLVGDTELTDSYSYDRTTGTLMISKKVITDNITIRVQGVINQYAVNTRISNLLFEGAAVANADARYSARIQPKTGYSLPDTVEVQVGTTVLDSGYTYDVSTGEIGISKSVITDNITIQAEGVANTYVVSHRLSKLTGNGATSAVFAQNYTTTLVPDENYRLPDAITIQVGTSTLTAGTDYSYSPDTGKVVIYAPAVTDTIVISADGVAVQKEEQEKPDTSTLIIKQPKYENTKEGKIIGVTQDMEYSLDGGITWTPCSTNTISKLAAGTVKIRFRETDTKKKSPAATIEMESITSEYYIPTISMSKKMGLNQKFQIKLMKVKGAAVKCVSTNPKIATVTKKGIIKSKKKQGKTKIVITIIKGKHIVQYVAKVTVSKKVGKNYSLVSFKSETKSPNIAFYKKIKKGNSWKIKLTHIKNAQLLFESSNKNVAIVDEKGRVRGDNAGKAVITITVKNGKVTDKYYAVVRVVDDSSTQDVSWLKVLK